MYGTIWALVPPIVAILLALLVKEAYVSLFAGVLLGALFVSNFNPVATLDTVVNDGLIAAIGDNAGIFLFLVLLGVIVALVNRAGGSAAFGRWAEKNIRTRVGALLATFLLGVLIFIDDYFNCLTVGSVMRPVTDNHRISRAKLAFLIDATAAPICMIAPVSSWAAAVSGVADDLGTGISGIQLFLRAIPYNFYSLLTLVFIIALALMNFDYGPMRVAEMAAQLEGNLGAQEGGGDAEANPRGRVIDLVLPVIVLIVTCTIGMLYVGGYFGGDYADDFIGAFGNTDAFVALPWGAVISLVFTFIYFLCRRVLSFKDAAARIPQGFVAMVPPMIILTLAVSLKTMTSSLGAADFVHDMMLGADSRLLIIGISACLAGAVCGDHCSPISDTTIMASAGAQMDHLQHVSTQLPYALTVAGVSFATYIVAGFVQNALISLAVGIALTVGALFVIRRFALKAGTPTA